MEIKRLTEKTVGKWGDTLVVGLKEEFREIGVKHGDTVAVEVRDGSINIKKSRIK